MSVQLKDKAVDMLVYRLYTHDGDVVQSHMPAEAALELVSRNVATKVDGTFGLSITVDGYEMRFDEADFVGVGYPEKPVRKKRGKAK